MKKLQIPRFKPIWLLRILNMAPNLKKFKMSLGPYRQKMRFWMKIF